MSKSAPCAELATNSSKSSTSLKMSSPSGNARWPRWSKASQRIGSSRPRGGRRARHRGRGTTPDGPDETKGTDRRHTAGLAAACGAQSSSRIDRGPARRWASDNEPPRSGVRGRPARGRPRPRRPGRQAAMSHVRHSIHIGASPEQVWAIGRDPERMPEWNTTVVSVKDADVPLDTPGSRFTVVSKIAGRPLDITWQIEEVETPKFFVATATTRSEEHTSE